MNDEPLAGRVVDSIGRPLGGVAVSDGLDVTVSAADGRWRLPARSDAEFVFATVPRTHQALRAFAIDVRGDDVDRRDLLIDLVPCPRRAGGRFRFVQVTDLHVSVDGGAGLRALHEGGVHPPPGVAVTGTITGNEVSRDLSTIVRRERPAFIAATGDLANAGLGDELAAYRAAADGCGVPVAHVPGNHDYLSCLAPAAIEEFGRWWEREGRHQPGADPVRDFQVRAFGGDYRRSTSGRVPWLDRVGPPYYSFDWGLTHFVVYDSEGLLRYGDDYPQDRWLAADLARVAPTTPVIVLLHFPEPPSFFAERFAGVDLVASFAGHWHADRVHEDDRGARHHATPTLGFGGIDHSPRGYRVVEVDGRHVRTWFQPFECPRRRRAAGGRRSPLRLSWEAAVDGLTGPGAPLIDDHVVIVGVTTPPGNGAVLARDRATGAERWRHDLPAGIKHSVVAQDDAVVGVTVTGLVVGVDAATGERRWEHQLPESGRRWCFGAPAIDGQSVYVAAPACVAAVDSDNDRPTVRWQHLDLAPLDWMTAWCSPVACADSLVLVFASEHAQIVRLDSTTGDVAWHRRGHELAAPCSSPVVVDDRIIVATVDGWLRAVTLTDGDDLWQAPLDGPWPAATPVSDGELVYTVGSGGTLHAHRADDGALVWAAPPEPFRQARRPYGRDLAGQLGAPVLAGGLLHLAAAGGALTGYEPESGKRRWRVATGRSLASTPAVVDGEIYVTTATGTLQRWTPR